LGCHYDPAHTKETHSGAKFRFGPAAATCAKASRHSRSRGTYEARGATRNFRTEVGSSTRRIPSQGAEQRRGQCQWVVSGQGFTYDIVKKGHARNKYFLLQTRNFWYFSAPSSLFTCCYLLSTRQCLSSAALAPRASSFDPAFLSDLRGLSWSSTGRWMRSAICELFIG
jgi:hypothetical protein